MDQNQTEWNEKVAQKIAEAVNNDMKLVANTIAENEELDAMLKSAVVKSEVKKETLIKIFSKVDGITKSLFEILISNKRIDILNHVALKYLALYDELKGKEIATVTTAIPLTAELEKKILAKVKTLTSKKVELKNIVDESILGGFILRVGDKQYNASIANKLNTLRREFTLN